MHGGTIHLGQILRDKLRPPIVFQVLRQHPATGGDGPRDMPLLDRHTTKPLSQQALLVIGREPVVGVDEGAEPTSRIVHEMDRAPQWRAVLERAARGVPPGARLWRQHPREGLCHPEVAVTGVPEKDVVSAVSGEKHLRGTRHVPADSQHGQGRWARERFAVRGYQFVDAGLRGGGQTDQAMVDAQLGGRRTRIRRFVFRVVGCAHGEGGHVRPELGHGPADEAGVEPAAQQGADGDVGIEASLHCREKEALGFLNRLVERGSSCGSNRRRGPVLFRVEDPVMPPHDRGGWHLREVAVDGPTIGYEPELEVLGECLRVDIACPAARS